MLIYPAIDLSTSSRIQEELKRMISVSQYHIVVEILCSYKIGIKLSHGSISLRLPVRSASTFEATTTVHNLVYTSPLTFPYNVTHIQ